MTNEERDLISRFIARVGGAPQSGGFLTGGGSVPSTQAQPQLPPIDREADAFIGQQFQQFPEARYRITQTAVVTEAALAEAQNRIKRLEWELEQTKNAAQQAMQQQAQAQPQQSGGFFSNIFGGGQQQRPAFNAQPGMQGGAQMGQPVWGGGYQPTTPPPQPQYAPGYQPGMFQRGGSGFLGSALTTAAGVAGGMVVGNALMGMFEGHRGSEMGGGGFGGAGGDGGGSSPWGAPAGGVADAGSNPFDGGGVLPTSDPTGGFGNDTAYNDPFAGSPQQDSGGWDQASGGFDDSSGGGGGFDDNNA